MKVTICDAAGEGRKPSWCFREFRTGELGDLMLVEGRVPDCGFGGKT